MVSYGSKISNMGKIMTWLPRGVAFLFIGLLVLLSFDSFSGEISFGQKLLGFLIHLVPAFSVAVCLLVAWKYRLFGGVLFLMLGMVFTIYFGTWKSASHFSLISLPLLVAGVLFMVSQWWVTEEG